MSDYTIDKGSVRKAFARAATSYDAAAVLQREIARRTLAHLDPIRIEPSLVLDLGAGTGDALGPLLRRYPRAKVLALDLALPMLHAARRKRSLFTRRLRYLCADADALPLPDASVDLVFSNLMLQWSPQLEVTLRECRRVLRPEGLLLFATLGPDTLAELHSAWSAVDGTTHVHRFLDMHVIGDSLVAAGFGAPVLETERLSVTYRAFGDLLRDLKALGATYAARGRSRGLLGPRKLAMLEASYRGAAATGSGLLAATYEVVYGHGWAWSPAGSRQDGRSPVQAPLSLITRR